MHEHRRQGHTGAPELLSVSSNRRHSDRGCQSKAFEEALERRGLRKDPVAT